MRAAVYEAEHEEFRKVVSAFVADRVVPRYEAWEQQGHIPKSVFEEFGALGLMGIAIPTAYGGGGVDDFRYNVILQEEAAAACVTFGTLRTQMDVVLPYLLAYCDDEQKSRWLPEIAAGRLLTAIAMTEPGTGSDLAGMRTRAVRDGDHYILSGAKTFITGGHLADLVLVVARTSDLDDRRQGLTLLAVDMGSPGVSRGRLIPKLGLRAQDTTELSFDEVRVPVSNRLGQEGAAFSYLSSNLAQERLAIAVGAVAQARAALTTAIAYVRERTVFGTSVASFQNTKFELASVSCEVEAAQAMVDLAVMSHVGHELAPSEAAAVKLFCTEMQGRAVDRCLQLFGGYGYVLEYPIARLYADARVTRIYGGTSEVMKTIVARSLGL